MPCLSLDPVLRARAGVRRGAKTDVSWVYAQHDNSINTLAEVSLFLRNTHCVFRGKGPMVYATASQMIQKKIPTRIYIYTYTHAHTPYAQATKHMG